MFIVTFPDNLDIVSIIESLQPFMTHHDSGIRIKGTFKAREFFPNVILAATIFKTAVIQKFDSLDSDSLALLKQFVIQKLDDSAVVMEALDVLSLFRQKNVLSENEVFSICVQ